VSLYCGNRKHYRMAVATSGDGFRSAVAVAGSVAVATAAAVFFYHSATWPKKKVPPQFPKRPMQSPTP
jgi:hypothetical protein